MELGVSRRLRDGADRTSESGWALLETMFAAALLVVIALAVMSSLDVASRTSAANKGRTVASALAEQDQERMRSMTIDQLSNYHTTTNPSVAGVAYTVDSRSEWIRDSTGTPASCSDTGQSDYVRISSTVTSNVVGKNTQPVIVRGIVAPPVGSLGPNQGTLAVKVVDRNAAPVAGLPVTLTGTRALTDATNSLGCAVFGYIPAGSGTNYTVQLNAVGWVDQDDIQLSTKSPNVTPGNVTLVQMTYDQAGSIQVDLKDSGGAAPSPAPTLLSVNNSLWPTPGVRRVPPSTVTSLFPFATSPYALYAGSCNSANPSASGTDSAASATVLPSQVTSNVLVRVPTVNVKVVDTLNTGTPAFVSLRATGAGCTEQVNRQATAADGTVQFDMPYGAYKICSSATAAGVTKYKIEAAAVNNNASAGTALQTLKPSSSSTGTGQCPSPLP
jgi:type II secretory pathway pseudopilin PulG